MSPALQARGAQWAERIDALSLRERVIAFVSIAVCLVALADQLAISPSLRQQGLWKQQAQRQEAELQPLRTQLGTVMALPGQPGPWAEARRALQQAEAQRQQLRAQLMPALSTDAASAPGASALPQLLGKVLQRHQRVTLVRFSTQAAGSGPGNAAAPALTATTLATATTATTATTAPSAAGAATVGTTPSPSPTALPAWQPALLTVRGQWADLQRFQAELEDSLPGLHWGELRLSTGAEAPLMTVLIWLPPAGGHP